MYLKKHDDLFMWFLLLINAFFITSQSIHDNILIESGKGLLGILPNVNVSKNNTCLSPGCEDAAKKIIANINTNKDPCKDFYKFACGNFISLSTIPDGKTTYNYITVVVDKVQQDLKNSLEGEVNSTEPKIYQLIKTYYKACMLKSPETDAENVKLLKSIIKQVGGWPIVEGKNWTKSSSKLEWTHIDSVLKNVGFSPQAIVNIFVFNHPRNTSKQILFVDPMLPYLKGTALTRSFSDPAVNAYEELFIKIATYLGAPKTRAIRDAREAILFEKKLLAASRTPNKNSTLLKIRRIKDLQTHAPYINWEEYINNMTEPVVHMNKSSRIYVRNPSYFMNIKSVLKETPKRTLANYMIWRFIAASVRYISEETLQMKEHFDRDSGKEVMPERWEECIKMVTKKSGLIVGVSALYVREHFDQRVRAAVTPILSGIADEVKGLMADYTWLDETSRIRAMKKADFMARIIAYPDELFEEEIIDNYVSSLSLSESNNFYNFLHLNRFHFNYSLGGLLENFNQRRWIELAETTVPNAYYFNIYNAFSILAAILQPPIFNPEWPTSVLFGSAGFIIGHEISHAFDLKNILFDETGSFTKWISKEDKENLKIKAKCFIQQYNKFKDKVFKININGRHTLNENLADNLGMRITVGAYNRWLALSKNQLKLPGLNYTTEQIFWLSAVSFMCSKKDEYTQMNDLLFNPHTPDGFRVIGTLQNSIEFSNTFDCPLGSPMNPEKKCVLY